MPSQHLASNVYTMYHSGMKIQINQWGNSLALRIPKSIASEMKIEQGSEVEMSIKNNALIISKPRYTLEELVSRITPENIHPETDTGEPVGNEIW